jgi:signal transduction histidine kinase
MDHPAESPAHPNSSHPPTATPVTPLLDWGTPLAQLLPPSHLSAFKHRASSSPIKIVAGGSIWSNLTALTQQISKRLQAPDLIKDLPKQLFQIARAVGEAFGVEGCAIVLPPDGGCPALVNYWVALPDHACTSFVLPALQAVIPLATVRCSNLRQEAAQPHQDPYQTAGLEALLTAWNSIGNGVQLPPLRAVVGIPIDLGSQGIGLLTVMRTQPYPWNDPEVHCLNLLAQQIGLGLANLPLQLQLQQNLTSQGVIYQVAQAIHSTQPLETIFQLAVDQTAQCLGASRGLLLRLKYWDPLLRYAPAGQLPKARVSVVQEWRGSPDLEVGLVNQLFWLSECDLCQSVFRQAEILVSQPHESSQQLMQRLDLAAIAPAFECDQYPGLLMAPLEHQGRMLGFLAFQHRNPLSWTESQQEFVRVIAAQMSTALIQTETLRQVQLMVDKRTAELKESLTIQAKLYERTRQQINQLRHLNQLKDEFLSTVSHELQTPLTSMTMAIKMLQTQGLEPERASRYLKILEDQCLRESELVKDLLMLQDVESGKMALQPTPLDLGALLRQLVQKIETRWAQQQVVFDLRLPAQLPLEADLPSLNRVLRELLTNATKFATPGSTITCEVSQRGPETVLRILNQGSGISTADLPYIFDKFRRAGEATTNAIAGTGLGLALAKGLVEQLNGQISVTSERLDSPRWPLAESTSQPGDNPLYETCFTLRLPCVLNTWELTTA